MGGTKFLTISQMMERYGCSRKKAEEIAFNVGPAPRRKYQNIYVNQEKADAYMGVTEE